MVSDSVPILHHALCNIRRRLEKMSHDKEGRRRIMLLQCIQNRNGISVFITAVESQIQYLFIALCHIIGVVVLHGVHRGIPRWFFTALAKAEPPVLRVVQKDRSPIRRGRIDKFLPDLPCCLLWFTEGFRRSPAQQKHGKQENCGRNELFPTDVFVV